MSSFGIPEHLIRITEMPMNYIECQVKIDGHTSTSFIAGSDRRQEDALLGFYLSLHWKR